MRTPLPPAIAALFVAATLLVVPPKAIGQTIVQSPDDPVNAGVPRLARRVEGLKSESRELSRKPWNFSAERALGGRLNSLADEFHGLAEQGTPMATEARALLALMESVRKRYTRVLEEMQAEVIRLDGDLEAVQDSKAWRDRETLAMPILYRLNWVRYEIAVRYETDTAKRSRLLVRARNGFAEMLGSSDRDLSAEALFGHGLCLKTMRQYDDAIGDFKAALEWQPGTQISWSIRTAMADALISAGRMDEALVETKRLTQDTPGQAQAGGEAGAQALFLRSKALLLAVAEHTGSYDDAARGALRNEAVQSLERLYQSGPYWRTKVAELVDAGVSDPLEWTAASQNEFVTWLIADSLRRRGQCDEAVRLYAALLERKTFDAEALYGLGYCSFHEGRYEDAVQRFSAYLDLDNGGGLESEAAYLRFKAAESIYLRGDNEGHYITFLEDFLARAPAHRFAFEAWFRLGQWHRDNSRFEDCADAFGKVGGDGGFRLKAMFLRAQCLVEAVAASTTASDVGNAPMVGRALAALSDFSNEAEHLAATRPKGERALLRPLEAKAALMSAAMVGRSGVGTLQARLDLLDGFEERFAGETTLFTEVMSLRVSAYASLGDLKSAGTELRRLLARADDETYQSGALKKLGMIFLKESSRLAETGDARGAAESRQVALEVYQKLLAAQRSLNSDTAGLEKLVEKLKAPPSD